MGKVFGTCGHELRGLSDNVFNVKEYDSEGERVVATICVCDECAKWYRRHRLVLKDEEAENRWFLEGK